MQTQENTDMSQLQDVYNENNITIPFDEFEQKAKAKKEEMGGLVDLETAATHIAQQIGTTDNTPIKTVTANSEYTEFTATIVGMGDLDTYKNTNDEPSQSHSDDQTEEQQETNYVLNIILGDESGSIKGVLWDETAETVATEYNTGDTVEIEGVPKKGYSDTEITINNITPNDTVDLDVPTGEIETISDINQGDKMVTVSGIVLSTSTENTFENDGSKGTVSNAVIGDQSGSITVTFWNDASSVVNSLSKDDTIEVKNADVRVDNETSNLELHLSSEDPINTIDTDLTYRPKTQEIGSVEINESATLRGTASVVENVKEFERDDGSTGRVQNVDVEDDTGSIRAALWGNATRPDLQEGSEIVLVNVEAEEGFQDRLEANLGFKSAFYVLSEPSADETSSENTGIGQYMNENNSDDSESVEQETESNSGDSTTDAQQADNETVEFTGTVIQTGDLAILDTADSKITVSTPTETDLRLGEEVTVRGTKTADGEVNADEIF
jgi:replication factor A1